MASTIFIPYRGRSVQKVAGAGRSAGIRPLQIGFFRAREEWRYLQSAYRSFEIATGRFALSSADSRRSRRCGARARPSFVLRYFAEENNDRLVLVNFGDRHDLKPAPEPLLAPPSGHRWETLWTSEASRYGGADSALIAAPEQWILPAESAVALRLVRETGNGD